MQHEPHRPWIPHRRPVRLANFLGPRVPGLRPAKLDEASVVGAAERRTGLSAAGDEGFRPGLRRLLTSLEEEARLHFLGRMWARGNCVNLVSNRLQMAADWERHPEILDEEIPRPLFIVGLSRTGTTLLQHLLGVDPANRMLLHWEAATPSPPPERATYATDPRIKRSERAIKLVYYMVPHGRALHPMAADSPTECVALLGHSLTSMELPASNHVPSYLSWLLDQDMRAPYRHYRRQLQLLQWRCGSDRWVLKSPGHLFALDALLDVFPDARIVQIHRDPVRVMGSFCSLTATLYGVGSDHVDPHAIGATWPAVWAEGLGRMMALRDQRGSGSFLDVRYADLVADPIAVVRRIYDTFELDLQPRVVSAMRDHLGQNRQDARGVHLYSLDAFGLDEQVEQERFAGYRTRFDVPEERFGA